MAFALDHGNVGHEDCRQILVKPAVAALHQAAFGMLTTGTEAP